MSNTKFTPGPWDLTTIGLEMRANDSDCAGTIFGPTDKFGGSPLIADISRSPGDLVADANARLIAAAPQMYEYLKWVCGLPDDLFPGQKKHQILALLNGINAGEGI